MAFTAYLALGDFGRHESNISTLPVRLLDPTLPDLEFIALHMRSADKAEIYGLLPHDNPFLLARHTAEICRMGGFCVVAYLERPVALMGFVERLPGCFEAFAYGTNEFPRVSVCLTRFALGHMKPALLKAGAHRLQCDSRFDHAEAHRWLRLLGFKEESTMKAYGKDKADYIRFVALASSITPAKTAEKPTAITAKSRRNKNAA